MARQLRYVGMNTLPDNALDTLATAAHAGDYWRVASLARCLAVWTEATEPGTARMCAAVWGEMTK